MEQIRRYRYKVKGGEGVIIEITPISVGPTVTAAQNGEPLDNSGSPDRPAFRFTVTEVVRNSHFVMLECSFLEEDSDDARFEITIEGSHGGRFTNIPPVKKTSRVLDPEFTFRVE